MALLSLCDSSLCQCSNVLSLLLAPSRSSLLSCVSSMCRCAWCLPLPRARPPVVCGGAPTDTAGSECLVYGCGCW